MSEQTQVKQAARPAAAPEPFRLPALAVGDAVRMRWESFGWYEGRGTVVRVTAEHVTCRLEERVPRRDTTHRGEADDGSPLEEHEHFMASGWVVFPREHWQEGMGVWPIQHRTSATR